jgi:hypothetical protein
MALSLTVPSDYGVAATYHRIGAVQINWLDRGATVVLFSYISNEARQSGKQPLGTVNITFSDADFDFDNDEPTRAALYAKIKQHGAWSDASDA